MRAPSGEKTGETSLAKPVVIRVAAPPAAGITNRCVPPSAAGAEKTTRSPEGDSAGESIRSKGASITRRSVTAVPAEAATGRSRLRARDINILCRRIDARM